MSEGYKIDVQYIHINLTKNKYIHMRRVLDLEHKVVCGRLCQNSDGKK